MTYTQNLEGCYNGSNDKAILHTFLKSNAQETFRTAFQKGHLTSLSLTEQKDDIEFY